MKYFVPLLALVMSLFTVRAYFHRLAPRIGAMDVPNARSGHTVVTPRGAGLVFALLALIALVFSGLPGLSRLLLSLALAIVIAVGLLDDLKGLPARLRLGVHLLSGVLVVGALYPVPAVALDYLLAFGLIIGIAWTVNLFNFMDGADGLAASQGLVMALGFGMLGRGDLQTVWFVLAAGLLGFLVWNWYPAKVFMGDAGSTCLGLMLGVGVVAEVATNGMLGLASLLMAGPFVLDASITLVRRVVRGEQVGTAHRLHFYQRWIDSGGKVPMVATIYSFGALVGVGIYSALVDYFTW